MISNSKVFFTVTVLLLISAAAFTQKVYQVHLKFAAELNTSKVKLFYFNGRDFKKVTGPFADDQVTISDSIYSKFAKLSCAYYKTRERSDFVSSFFIANTSASIVFNKIKDTLANPFLNYTLINAYNVDSLSEAKKFKSFISVEFEDYANFSTRFGDVMKENDSLNAIGKSKYHKLMNKELQFYCQNGNQYYSLWLFKEQLFQYMDNFLTAESLLKIFDNAFTTELKNTFEGKQIKTTLTGRINISDNDYGNNFKSIDINNKPVDLKTYKGKYVLINFWASWCGPCIAELPTIKRLNAEYGKGKLAVISASIDTDKKAFMHAVKKHGINWTNIFHDTELEKIFLKTYAIPQVYLIDPYGKLVYSREEEKDYDLNKLTEILKKAKM
jgi:thiol-disulfide isomerase/thioredoxin